jgi:RNA polymerase sigma-70 factor (ECF subfamily)
MLNTWAIGFEESMGADSELVGLRRGDPDAFDALLTRYQNRLYRYLIRFTGDLTLAEDLFQQTWLSVMTRIDRYDPRKPFEPWLFAVARNLAIDHFRRTAPSSLDEPTSTGETKLDRLSSDEPGLVERLMEGERISAIEQKMAELPAIYREALTLRFEEEMTFEEMAAVLDTPVSTVKSRVQRALETLRRKIRPRREALG